MPARLSALDVSGTALAPGRPPKAHLAGRPSPHQTCRPTHPHSVRQVRPSSSRSESTKPPDFMGCPHSGQAGAALVMRRTLREPTADLRRIGVGPLRPELWAGEFRGVLRARPVKSSSALETAAAPTRHRSLSHGAGRYSPGSDRGNTHRRNRPGWSRARRTLANCGGGVAGWAQGAFTCVHRGPVREFGSASPLACTAANGAE